MIDLRSKKRACFVSEGMIEHRVLLLIVAALFLSPFSALSQAFPNKPVRLVVPYAAGGGTDTIARLLGQRLSDKWEHGVVVDNRAGAGTIIGTELVARSAPDGHTMLLVANPFTTNVVLNPKLPYDTLRDFAPITMVASAPLLLVVNPSLPVRSVDELTKLAKNRPGQLSFGSSGNGGPQHLAGELYNTMAGVKTVHIPYKGSAPAGTALIAGEVPFGFVTMTFVTTFVKAGRLRALAVTSLQRSALMPAIPTMHESGLPGYETTAWYGIFVPAATPRSVAATLNAEITRVAKLPEIKERLAKEGAEVVANDAAAFTEFVRADVAKIRELAAATSMKVD